MNPIAEQIYLDTLMLCLKIAPLAFLIGVFITKFSNGRDRIWYKKKYGAVDCVVQDRESCGLNSADPTDAVLTVPLKNLIYADAQKGELFLQFKGVEKSTAVGLVSCLKEFQEKVDKLLSDQS